MKSLNIIYMRVCLVPMTYDRSPQTLNRICLHPGPCPNTHDVISPCSGGGLRHTKEYGGFPKLEIQFWGSQ